MSTAPDSGTFVAQCPPVGVRAISAPGHAHSLTSGLSDHSVVELGYQSNPTNISTSCTATASITLAAEHMATPPLMPGSSATAAALASEVVAGQWDLEAGAEGPHGPYRNSNTALSPCKAAAAAVPQDRASDGRVAQLCVPGNELLAATLLSLHGTSPCSPITLGPAGTRSAESPLQLHEQFEPVVRAAGVVATTDFPGRPMGTASSAQPASPAGAASRSRLAMVPDGPRRSNTTTRFECALRRMAMVSTWQSRPVPEWYGSAATAV
jgi:hypothetical protein